MNRPALEWRAAPSLTKITGDGAIRLEASDGVLGSLASWLPSPRAGVEAEAVGEPGRVARIRIRQGEPAAPPMREPDFAMGTAAFWREEDPATLTLAGAAGSGGSVDLARGEATIVHGSKGGLSDLPDLLTVSIGLLAGGVGRALIHGGAVVAPDERVWLVAGPSGSGKSTMTANLIRAGWDYLADDRTFLRWGEDEDEDADEGVGRPILVEGWLRDFLLDPAFPGSDAALDGAARSRSDRAPLDPAGLGPGRPRGEGVLGGILFPEIVASGETSASPLSRPETLRRMIRESPWLFGSPATARDALELLAGAAAVPAYALQLAPDTRHAPERLGEVLGDVCAGDPSLQASSKKASRRALASAER